MTYGTLYYTSNSHAAGKVFKRHHKHKLNNAEKKQIIELIPIYAFCKIPIKMRILRTYFKY